MASFKFYLKDKKSSIPTPIYLLFDNGVNRSKLYIQESISPKDWNATKGEARKTLNGYSDFNFKLNKIKDGATGIHTELTKRNEFTLIAFRERFRDFIDVLNNRAKKDTSTAKNSINESLVNFAKYHIDLTTDKLSYNTILTRIQTLELLKDFEQFKKIKLTFDAINLDTYDMLVSYLKRQRKLSPHTIGKHIKNFKLFLNEATERGYNKNFEYKKKKFTATIEKNADEVENIYLTDSEIIQLYRHDFSNDKKLEKVRDLFVIGCYTGLRFSDLTKLNTENINGDFINVSTQKTNDKVIVPIHFSVREILSKYEQLSKGLPRSISNQKMNKYLKEIGELAGINTTVIITKTRQGLKTTANIPKYKLMTTHTARRSFATNLYKSDFPTIEIMKITGHRTETAFMKYIKVTKEETAQRLKEHWHNTALRRAI